jgi:hypothetical protein
MRVRWRNGLRKTLLHIGRANSQVRFRDEDFRDEDFRDEDFRDGWAGIAGRVWSLAVQRFSDEAVDVDGLYVAA